LRAANINNLDFILIICTLASFVVGVGLVFSATNGDKEFAIRQSVYGVIGLVLMLLVAHIDFRILESFALPIYVVTIGLLGVVLVIGHVAHGSQRWINLGFFPLQPSELAKFTLIIVLARLLASHAGQLHKIKWFLAAGAVTAIPAVLVFEQPDLGTAMMLGAIFLGVTLASGVRKRFFVGAAVLAIPAIYVFWTRIMHDYQRDRFLTFLDPEKDPTLSGYNIIQSRIAVGSGGWLGQGYMAGNQSQLEFLKVRYSDFIFSVIGEEFGLIGSLALVALLFILVWRCIVVAQRSQDDFGSLIAIGVASWIGMQVFINVGMNIGLMPVTGIPLPFISYGGSALISMFLGLGLVQSVAMRSSPVIFGHNGWSPLWLRWARTTVRTR
jgi:rod shape determining protein RodA